MSSATQQGSRVKGDEFQVVNIEKVSDNEYLVTTYSEKFGTVKQLVTVMTVATKSSENTGGAGMPPNK
jgi:hypothetical protein